MVRHQLSVKRNCPIPLFNKVLNEPFNFNELFTVCFSLPDFSLTLMVRRGSKSHVREAFL